MTADYSKVSLALAEALQEISFYRALLVDFTPGSPEWQARLARYFEYSLQEGDRLGVSTLPAAGDFGAAIWTFPNAPELLKTAEAEKEQFLEGILGPQGFQNHRRMIDFMQPRVDPQIVATGWYLSILGVSPACQNQGLGQQLLAPILARADQWKTTCYVETFSSRNLSFYQRQGFQEASSFLEPVTQSEYWVLVREPSRL
jgi:GNAT superfamily N-acetyltransferase